MAMDRIVGIDLGTSTSCLSVVENGKPMVVPDGRGNRVTPSYIHVMEDGRILVGPQAKMEVLSDPYSTIWATKRLIGRRFQDPEVQEAKKYFGYGIVEGEDGTVMVEGRGKKLSPVEVGAIILKYLTRIGKKSLGEDVKRAVITVPAYFTDPQRKDTRKAGTMIGIDVVRLVNEPTAAALAYGYEHEEEQTIAVYDLGGGTFDLSILAIGQGVYEVMATDGDSYLGGEDFDNRLVDFLAEDFKKKWEIDIHNDKMAHQRVKDAAERTKIALSSKGEAEINLPGICPDLNRYAGVEAVITKSQYEGMVEDLVDRTIKIFRKLLEDTQMSLADIDNIIMVGGMTRMPLVQKKVTEFYGREPDTSVNPDEAVAMGAAIHAASLSGEKLLRRKPRPAAPAPGPLDLTVPGEGPDLERTLGPAGEQDMTRPGEAVPEAVEEPGPIELEPPPPFELSTPSDEVMSMDKDEADTSIAADPADMPVGMEWVEDKTPTPAPVELQQPEPGVEGLDDFFASSSAKTAAGAGEEPEDEEVIETAEPIYDESGEEEIPLDVDAGPEPIDLEEEPPPMDVHPPVQEEPEPMEVHPPAQDLPVSTGPIIRDFPEPAETSKPSFEEEDEEYMDAPVLLDVLSQSVGIAHFGGHFVSLIKRFSKLPARATQTFTTCADNQERIRISVLQGEGRYVTENTPLGEFVLENIEKTKRGLPEIEVCFDIDQSGLFRVSARDMHTGAEQEIRLEAPASASEEGEAAGA